MKRLFRLKNITTGKYHRETNKKVVHKGTKRKLKHSIGDIIYFENKVQAKEVRDILGKDTWCVTIGEDHYRFMG